MKLKLWPATVYEAKGGAELAPIPKLSTFFSDIASPEMNWPLILTVCERDITFSDFPLKQYLIFIVESKFKIASRKTVVPRNTYKNSKSGSKRNICKI